MFDADIAAEEAGEFYKAGGSTIVDVTSIGIGRDPQALLRISRASGLNVVMGGGHYVYLTHGENIHKATVEELAEGDHQRCPRRRGRHGHQNRHHRRDRQLMAMGRDREENPRSSRNGTTRNRRSHS